MYKYLFGPVPSRRLGMSLGVDLVPRKVCSLDCVYCEVGKTTKLTIQRREYLKYDKITQEISDYFLINPDPDYITFSGSGEPTLNSRIGDVLQFIKQIRPNIPVAVLTNGTLMNDKNVRKELLDADVILPSLDAATQSGFVKINKPAPEINILDYIQGLVDLRQEFKGEIWLEVFILPDYNDNKEELLALKDAILRIKPDKVQLNTLDRPGNLGNLRAATYQQLQDIVELWQLDNVEIIASSLERQKVQSYRKDLENVILETVARRPCTSLDIIKITGLHINEINKYLDVLETKGEITNFRLNDRLFYQIKNL